MRTADPIFPPRRPENEHIQPAPQALAEFLERTNKAFVNEPHDADLARYRRLLSKIEEYEKRRLAAEQRDPGDRMLYGVLLHSRFVNRELLLAVGSYKYHLHQLASLDFGRPTEFLENTELRLKTLSKRKIDDVMRILRLEEMVAERKQLLEKLTARWNELTADLRDIIHYIRDNLVRMHVLCRDAASLFAYEGLAQAKEKQLVAEIRAEFKEELTRTMQVRKVTTEDVAWAKEEVQALSRELASIIAYDIAHVKQLYGAVAGHVRRTAGDIDRLLAEAGGGTREEQLLHYRRIEQDLVSLVTGFPALLEGEGPRPYSLRSPRLLPKRMEMLDHLFVLAKGEQRKRNDRRRGNDPNYQGPERRRGRNRRTGPEKRSSTAL